MPNQQKNLKKRPTIRQSLSKQKSCERQIARLEKKQEQLAAMISEIQGRTWDHYIYMQQVLQEKLAHKLEKEKKVYCRKCKKIVRAQGASLRLYKYYNHSPACKYDESGCPAHDFTELFWICKLCLKKGEGDLVVQQYPYSEGMYEAREIPERPGSFEAYFNEGFWDDVKWRRIDPMPYWSWRTINSFCGQCIDRRLPASINAKFAHKLGLVSASLSWKDR